MRIDDDQLLGMTSGIYDLVNDPDFVAAYAANPLLPFSAGELVPIVQRGVGEGPGHRHPPDPGHLGLATVWWRARLVPAAARV